MFKLSVIFVPGGRGVGLLSAVFSVQGSKCSFRSNDTFLWVYSLHPTTRSSLKRFWVQNRALAALLAYMCSHDRGFYQLDRPLVLAGPKSLNYYNTCRVHISETVIKSDSKLELQHRLALFELLVVVL